jgi:hypothetical protein
MSSLGNRKNGGVSTTRMERGDRASNKDFWSQCLNKYCQSILNDFSIKPKGFRQCHQIVVGGSQGLSPQHQY